MTSDNTEQKEKQFRIYFTSGKTINDLGLYDYCEDTQGLKYALVIVKNNASDDIKQKREVKFGLCVPRECTHPESLSFMDNFYIR